MKDPQITTIIPTFRRPQLVKRAIQSILNQSYPSFKICVYDNASQEETREGVSHMASRDSRIHYFSHPRNIGARANCQFGMDRVETPFFHLLSDDDVVLPHFFELAMKGFKEHPYAAFSGGSTAVMSPEGEIVSQLPDPWTRYGYFEPPDGLLEMLGREVTRHIAWDSVVFRKEVLGSVTRLETAEGVPCDVDLFFQIAGQFPFYLAEEICAVYNVHEGNPHQTSHLLKRYFGWALVMRKFCEDSRFQVELRERVRSLSRIQLRQMLYNFYDNLMVNKNFKEGALISEILRDDHDLRFAPFLQDRLAKILSRHAVLHRAFVKFKIYRREKRNRAKLHEANLKKFLNNLEREKDSADPR